MEAVKPFTVLITKVGAVSVMAHSKWHAIEIAHTIYWRDQPLRGQYRIQRKRRKVTKPNTY